MTPTEQAADRVKAWIATPNTFEYPDADDLTALLSALTALQARAEDAERRGWPWRQLRALERNLSQNKDADHG